MWVVIVPSRNQFHKVPVINLWTWSTYSPSVRTFSSRLSAIFLTVIEINRSYYKLQKAWQGLGTRLHSCCTLCYHRYCCLLCMQETVGWYIISRLLRWCTITIPWSLLTIKWWWVWVPNSPLQEATESWLAEWWIRCTNSRWAWREGGYWRYHPESCAYPEPSGNDARGYTWEVCLCS